MVDVSQRETKDVTAKLLAALVLTTIFFTVFSIIVITGIVGNFYAAGSYTISALFDAVGIGQSSLFTAAVPLYSTQFDIIVGLSIIDGLIKIMIIGFFVAALINVITSIDLGSRLASMSKRNWKDHIIICGYSLLAERVAIELAQKKIPFLVIDSSPAKTDEIREAGFTALHEDFTTDIALKNAAIEKASAIMFLTVNDYNNLLGVITARHLNSKIKIITRADDSNSVTKIHRAGAELCVVPEVLAGIELGEAIFAHSGTT